MAQDIESGRMGKQKRFRQGQILNLVSNETIHNQEELRRRLAQLKIRVTQATLSRDIHELQLVKTDAGYKALQAAALADTATGPGTAHTALARALREFLLDMRAAQNLLVLKTPPGSANAIGVALDQEKWKEVVGTIAGDDTLLIITDSPRTRAAVQKRMEEMLK
jgi:transcriptional regulator of arginine metabolism